MQFTKEQVDEMVNAYANLSEKDKEALRRLAKSETGNLISQILGPQFTQLMGRLAQPRRGLAAPR